MQHIVSFLDFQREKQLKICDPLSHTGFTSGRRVSISRDCWPLKNCTNWSTRQFSVCRAKFLGENERRRLKFFLKTCQVSSNRVTKLVLVYRFRASLTGAEFFFFFFFDVKYMQVGTQYTGVSLVIRCLTGYLRGVYIHTASFISEV